MKPSDSTKAAAAAAGFLVIACASWRPTPEAIERRRIAGDLRVCRADSNGWPAGWATCNRIAAEWCELAGLERDCGASELWFACVGDDRSGPPGSVPAAAWCTPPVDGRTRL